jgi:hypothetical protein
MKTIIATIVAVLCTLPVAAETSWLLDLEAAMVNAESNDVGIPADGGTRFSLTDDLKTDDDVAFRLGVGLRLGQRHSLTAVWAPLTLYANGNVDFDILYNGEVFPAGTDLEAVYKFNTYRLRWTYDLVRSDRFVLGLGLTGLVRDAAIEVRDAERSTSYDNLGVVPLLNLLVDWRWTDKIGLMVQADAAASPGGEGRAEDVLVAVTVRPFGTGAFRLGYRFIEGGADVDEVYNFAWLSYYIFGWSQRF